MTWVADQREARGPACLPFLEKVFDRVGEASRRRPTGGARSLWILSLPADAASDPPTHHASIRTVGRAILAPCQLVSLIL